MAVHKPHLIKSMDPETKSTKPKPFVFVLMPFDSRFDDIYKYGIKGAAEEAGAYAERVDEQIFTEGILDRVFNQINKADVVVADMTDRNPNVFYEVGYAHALDKIVLLVTQRVEDIPFDLQHHQHTIYAGKIELLRKELVSKIEWAVKESAKIQTLTQKPPYEISLGDIYLQVGFSPEVVPLVSRIVPDHTYHALNMIVRNGSSETSKQAGYVYLFSSAHSDFRIYGYFPADKGKMTVRPLKAYAAHVSDAPDELYQQHRLPVEIPELPPGASVELSFAVTVESEAVGVEEEESFRLRIHTGDVVCDYRFRLAHERRA
jgi:hypothetical protein